MKNKFAIISGLLLISIQLFAQSSSICTIQKNGYDGIELLITVGELQTETMNYQDNTYSRLLIEGFQQTTDVGNPTLPILVKTIEIPLCDSVIVTYSLRGEKIEKRSSFSAVFPAQISYPKSYKGERTFTKNDNVYQTNAFYGKEIVEIEEKGVMRNVNLATLKICPVQYNPITNELKTVEQIAVFISFINADIQATEEMKRVHSNFLFSSENTPAINPMPSQQKDEISTAPQKYLIVSHSMFRGELNEFIAWKKRKGFIVQVAYTDEANVGTTYESIQAYIKSTYTDATIDNPAPTYVLLVGDVDQIPAKRISAFWSSHPTDLYYFTWTNGDYLPDCYYGRFSANSINELRPQIEKTLLYEQVAMSDPSYLDKALLIAGTDSYWAVTHGDGQVNYITSNYFTQDYGYTTIYKYNYNCSSQAATIRSQIGEGIGWVNYTAHGLETEWSDPEFTAAQISTMNNEGKYGVMIGNCCLSNKFDVTSFGESLVRADKKGALAYIGASNSTYWDEDVYWAVGYRQNIAANMNYEATYLGMYDRLFHQHNEPNSDHFVSLGQMIAAGNLAVENAASSRANYYWEVYHLMGDPSIMPWLTQPETMNVTHSTVEEGITSLQVTAVPYAYVALTDSLQLLAAGFADHNGQVTLSFPEINDLENVELAVSAQNFKTYFNYFGSSSPANINDDQLVTTLFPNPAQEYLTISANQPLKLIEIYDVTGKLIKQIQVAHTPQISINLKDMNAGIFFVKIIDENNTSFIHKVIKQ